MGNARKNEGRNPDPGKPSRGRRGDDLDPPPDNGSPDEHEELPLNDGEESVEEEDTG